MVVRSFIAVLLLIGVGFFIGVAQSQNVVSHVPALASLVQSPSPEAQAAPIVRCADEVSTNGWQTFRSVPLAYTFQYPPDFSLTDNANVLTLDDGSGNTITLVKLRQSLSIAVDSSMKQASWKVADRNTYALTTPYVTNDDGTLSTTYLFIRNFPQYGTSGNYDMVRATVTLHDAGEESSVAHEAGIMDPETVLNPSEQVLSTFRFLQNDEIDPQSGGE
ncbi:MAG TPA: hypothetical protein VHA78_04975 [Candidatus Peribacteraceae bacterium]|nr:hypothetical protein [Candidatus Peribacteraceae bacterium]